MASVALKCGMNIRDFASDPRVILRFAEEWWLPAFYSFWLRKNKDGGESFEDVYDLYGHSRAKLENSHHRSDFCQLEYHVSKRVVLTQDLGIVSFYRKPGVQH